MGEVEGKVGMHVPVPKAQGLKCRSWSAQLSCSNMWKSNYLSRWLLSMFFAAATVKIWEFVINNQIFHHQNRVVSK